MKNGERKNVGEPPLKWREKTQKWSKLCEMARNGSVGGGFRVLACADMLARTPLGVRQYFPLKLNFFNKFTYQES
jgi:hypothetical protein